MRYISATVTMIIEQDQGQTSQRVKVGMIGLAAVLLLILFAAAVYSTANRDRPVAVAGGVRPDVVANLVAGNQAAPGAAATSEPLADMGVAPSAPIDNGSAGRPPHPPR
ncbi:hypothetical protein QH494_04350 [Sphingomonas sp. AR_OL41]|jgi:hypothetical protein|uniref:hypothetical protein n=1 Tax=Sphingomonas sp. AR_OL41 TaxID=3042729 RepID=UPI0024812622|nr:hypothetical protein [Sphingomonas sp. AR_OL41]MDH7971403.1 hypothetical protein [Sphingomonas sp. AR_OL41]